MRKQTIVLLLSCIILICLSGCGTVKKATVDVSVPAPQVSETPATTENEVQNTESFLSALHGINSTYLQGLGVQGTETTIEQSSLSAQGGFSTMAIGYVDTYPYWEAVAGNKTVGQINETWEAKRRYYDKRTPGVPFNKPSTTFTATDWANLDYIEQLQVITGVYAQSPSQQLYRIFYHHKIISSTTTFTYSSFPGKTSTLTYYSYPNNNTTQSDTLNITAQTLTYTKSTGRMDGTLSCVGANTQQNKATITISAQGQTILSEKIQALYNNKAISQTEIAGASGKIETTYYVGPNATYYYSDISGLINERKIEDNATIEIQDSRTYNQSFIFNGLGANHRLDQTQPLKAFTLRGKAGQRPIISGTMTLQNITGVTIENITFTNPAAIKTCTGVQTINTAGTINILP